jgi:hypothetical protein
MMTKRKINFVKIVWLVLLCVGVTLFSANYSQALPLSNVKISSNTSEYVYILDGWRNVNTNYRLYADEFQTEFGDPDGWLDAFCVENAWWNSEEDYALEPLPSNLLNASLIADQYWHGSLSDKRIAQLAIWEMAIDGDRDLGDGNFRYNGTYVSSVQDIIDDLGSYSLSGNPIGFANSPPGSAGLEQSQNYLVKGVSVPDADIMLLLGTALLSLSLLSRKFKRS